MANLLRLISLLKNAAWTSKNSISTKASNFQIRRLCSEDSDFNSKCDEMSIWAVISGLYNWVSLECSSLILRKNRRVFR